MLPGRDFSDEVGFELTRDNWMLPGVCGAPEPEYPSIFVAGSAGPTPDMIQSSALSVMGSGRATPTSMSVPEDEHSTDEDRLVQDPAIPLRNLRGAAQWSSWSQHMTSHLGKSLGIDLIRTAVEMCKDLLPDAVAENAFRVRNKVWEPPSVSILSARVFPPDLRVQWLDSLEDEVSR